MPLHASVVIFKGRCQLQQPKGIAIVKTYPDETRKSLRVKMTTAPSLDAVKSVFKFVKVGRCYMIFMVQ
jgi:hypothetical protein